MAWNPQQEYPYLQMHQQEWNPYAVRPNGMWNMMSIFPGLLPGANLSHTGLMHPMNGNSSVPQLGSYINPGLNKRAGEHPLLVPQAEVSPPLSPHDIDEHAYEPPKLPEPSLSLTSLSPPHSPPLDLNDTKYSIPTGLLPTHPHAHPFLHPSLGTTPFSLGRGFPFPQTVQEPCEGHVAPLAAGLLNPQMADGPAAAAAAAAAVALLNPHMADVPTRDANGRKLPRWMIKRSVCQICNKRFESRHKLQLHMYAHTGERPHLCETCGMRFARKFCYKRHLKTHTTVKPHNCTRCGRGFREKYDMETHLMTEVCLRSTQIEGQSTTAGEQCFTCKECNASFTTEQELNTHSQVHKEPSLTMHGGVYKEPSLTMHGGVYKEPSLTMHGGVYKEPPLTIHDEVYKEPSLTIHGEVYKEPSLTTCDSKAKISQLENLEHDHHGQNPENCDNQENQTDQLYPQELQFNFREQMAAFKKHQDIVYPDHKPVLYHSTEAAGDAQ